MKQPTILERAIKKLTKDSILEMIEHAQNELKLTKNQFEINAAQTIINCLKQELTSR